jgi:hypothetical protein
MDKDTAQGELRKLSFANTLPEGWRVEERYDSTYLVDSNSDAHVVVQVWDLEGDGPNFVVRGNTPTGRAGITEANKNTVSGHATADDAQRVAIQMAKKFYDLYSSE